MPAPDRSPIPPRHDRARAERARARRSPGAIAVSVVVHAGLVLLLAQAIGVTRPLTALFRLPPRPTAETVTYVEPRQALPAPEPEGGGDGRPAASAPRVAAPVATPNVIPAPSPSAEPIVEAPVALPPSADGAAGRGTGSGSGVGTLTGLAAGLRPTYTDSPVWARPCLAHECPTTFAERLDSVVAGDLAAVRDSMVRAAAARRPGDWTFERNGEKWGMDEKFIRLGKISIPTAVLGALNFRGAQANPNALERQRTLEPMYQLSREQTLRRRNEATFDDVVKSIRERKDRERAAARAARTASRDTTRRAP